MYLKRHHFTDVTGAPTLQKALALALLIKHRIGRCGLMKRCTTNKLHDLTGVSAVTIEKYMPYILHHDWLKIENGNLIAPCLGSNCRHRNIDISQFNYNSFADVYRSLRAFIALSVQSKKEFLKHVIQAATEPQNLRAYKCARRIVKSLVKRNILPADWRTFKENGLSFRRIARETGNCITTAQRIIKYAIAQCWVTKHSNRRYMLMPFIRFREWEGATYSTLHHVCYVGANSYTLADNILSALQCGTWYGIYLGVKK